MRTWNKTFWKLVFFEEDAHTCFLKPSVHTPNSHTKNVKLVYTYLTKPYVIKSIHV